MRTKSIEISVRLSAKQTVLIWPGLDFIVRAFQTRTLAGQAHTSFPFGLQQLPTGFDSGTFSPMMMARVDRLGLKLKAKARSGGRIRMDAFELRVAALSVRVTKKLQRMGNHKMRATGKADRNLMNLKGIRSPERQIKRLISSLERQMKRANRRLLSQVSEKQFRASSREWQSHLRWMRFRLVYFKPFRPLPGYRKKQQETIGRLVQMAKQAILAEKLKVPDERDLRRVIRQFIRYSRRGRQGAKHHRYMLSLSESIFARSELLQFVKHRINLRNET